jgi:hypothetical protein
MSIDDAIRATRVLLDRIETVAAVYQDELGVKGKKKQG